MSQLFPPIPPAAQASIDAAQAYQDEVTAYHASLKTPEPIVSQQGHQQPPIPGAPEQSPPEDDDDKDKDDDKEEDDDEDEQPAPPQESPPPAKKSPPPPAKKPPPRSAASSHPYKQLKRMVKKSIHKKPKR